MNAFFVAAEFGMVKLRSTRVEAIKKNYGWRGIILEKVHQHLDAYLSACQLGITLASLGLGWVGEPAFAYLLEPFLSFIGIQSQQLIKVIAFVVAFSCISFLHIVVGELMPKSLAIRQSEKVSVWTVVPLYAFYWVMYPAIWMLNTCSNFFLNLMGLGVSQSGDHIYSTDEIKLILNASHIHGELTQDETEIIEHTIEFADLDVTEVMRPRDEIVSLNINDPIQDLIKKMMESRYSRYPIYDPKHKTIIGIIHIKDIFAVFSKASEAMNLEPYIRPILKVPHYLPAIDLLRKFREGGSHFALVYKGKQHLLGFITLDNLLHVLIGRIQDEFHKTQDDWIKNPDNTFAVKGGCSIYSLEQALDKEISLLPDEENLDTLAGLIVVRAGTLPKVGDTIHFKEFDALIEELHGTYIRKVKVTPK